MAIQKKIDELLDQRSEAQANLYALDIKADETRLMISHNPLSWMYERLTYLIKEIQIKRNQISGLDEKLKKVCSKMSSKLGQAA